MVFRARPIGIGSGKMGYCTQKAPGRIAGWSSNFPLFVVTGADGRTGTAGRSLEAVGPERGACDLGDQVLSDARRWQGKTVEIAKK
jgi:hypothetical protein